MSSYRVSGYLKMALLALTLGLESRWIQTMSFPHESHEGEPTFMHFSREHIVTAVKGVSSGWAHGSQGSVNDVRQ